MTSRWNADWQRLGSSKTEIAAACVCLPNVCSCPASRNLPVPRGFFSNQRRSGLKEINQQTGTVSGSLGRGQTFALGQCLDQVVKPAKAGNKEKCCHVSTDSILCLFLGLVFLLHRRDDAELPTIRSKGISGRLAWKGGVIVETFLRSPE